MQLSGAASVLQAARIFACTGLLVAGSTQALEFGEEIPLAGGLQSPSHLCLADLDGDGDEDLLCASAMDDKLSWFPRQGMSFAAQRVISSHVDYASCVEAADLDLDGDLDLLASAAGSGEIVLCEGLGGGEFLPARVLIRDLAWPRDLLISDLNGDELPDFAFVCADSDRVYWCATRADSLSFDSPVLLDDSLGAAWSICAGDPDGDGDTDLLAGGMLGDCMRWYRNEDGAGEIVMIQEITQDAYGLRDVALADLDGDGDLDALSASAWDQKVAWYRNADFAGGFGARHTLPGLIPGASNLLVHDLDADGDNDLLVSSADDGCIYLYENTNAQATFGQPQLVMSGLPGVRSLASCDLNLDGIADPFAASWDSGLLQWTVSQGELQYAPPQHLGVLLQDPLRLFPADLDGDGDTDLAATCAGDGTLIWFSNTDGLGGFSEPLLLGTGLDSALALDVFDIDGDQDLDILVGAARSGRLSVFRNEGQAEFAEPVLLDTPVAGVCFLDHTDLDGDSYDELLVTCFGDSCVRILDNNAGDFNYCLYHQYPLPWVNCGRFADLDGDGDQDLLLDSATSYLYLLYNLDGQGSFSDTSRVWLQYSSGTHCALADLNEDGWQDLIHITGYRSTLSYLAGDGVGPFSGEYLLDEFSGDHHWACVLDADSDGDPDLITPTHHLENGYYFLGGLDYFENLGQGEFAERHRLHGNLMAPNCVVSADFNQDGVPDIAACSRGDNKIVWYPGLEESSLIDPYQRPQGFSLQAYPNPFNPVTQLELELDVSQHVHASLYNLRGQRLQTLYHGSAASGDLRIPVDGSTLASGVYLAAVRVGDQLQVRRLSLIR